MPSKMCTENIYSFLNFNCITAEVREWINNHRTHLILDVIVYPSWDKNNPVSKVPQVYSQWPQSDYLSVTVPTSLNWSFRTELKVLLSLQFYNTVQPTNNKFNMEGPGAHVTKLSWQFKCDIHFIFLSSYEVIATKFCTWHDSHVQNLQRSQYQGRNHSKSKFHQTWVTWDKLFIMKRALDMWFDAPTWALHNIKKNGT